MIENVYCSSCKVPLNILERFFEKYSNNFLKIRPLGGELFLGDRRTDMTKLMAAFRNFANEPIIGGNRKRKPSAVLCNVFTKWTCIIMSVKILTEMESSEPLRGWRILRVFKRISIIGWKEANLKYLAHHPDPL